MRAGGQGDGAETALSRHEATSFIVFAALIAFPLLYLFRAFDDNTLTSWRWVFPGTGVAATFIATGAALVPAFFLSRIEPRRHAEPCFLLLGGLAALAPLWSVPEPIIDASRYFVQAKYAAHEGFLAFWRHWGGELGAWTDLPVVPFFFGILFRVFGEHRIVIQLFTTLLFALSAVHTFHIGRRLWDRETGFLAGVLLLAMPYLLVQVPLMLVDVPALFLMTLSVHAYLRTMDRGGWSDGAGAAAAVAAAALAKYSTWPMLLLLPLITLLWARDGRKGAVRRSAVVLGSAVAGVGAFLLWRHDVVRSQLALLRSYQWPALGRWGESATSTFLFQVHPFVTAAATAGVVRAFRLRDARFLVPAWFLLFIVVFQVERIRYLLPLFPLFALMSAYGLRGLFGDGATRRFAAYSAASASLVLVFTAYQPFLGRTTMANLRDAGAFLDSLPGETVAVSVLAQRSSTGNTEAAVPLLDLFTRKTIVYDRRAPARPGRETIDAAPLRFTWEQRLPPFYDGNHHGRPLSRAVITGQQDAFPGALGAFAADTGNFRYRTAVFILSASAHPEHAAVPFGTAR